MNNPGQTFSSRDHLMSPGFRRKVSPSTLGLVRETAKVGVRTDTSGHPAESVEPLLLHKIGPMDAKKQGVPTKRAWRCGRRRTPCHARSLFEPIRPLSWAYHSTITITPTKTRRG